MCPVTPLAAERTSKRNQNDAQEPVISALLSTPAPKRSKSSSAIVTPVTQKKAETNDSVEVIKAKQPPKGWQEIYSLVEELRQDRTAPCVRARRV